MRDKERERVGLQGRVKTAATFRKDRITALSSALTICF
jgi:hypothetical protein